jgi:hypothetical protein
MPRLFATGIPGSDPQPWNEKPNGHKEHKGHKVKAHRLAADELVALAFDGPGARERLSGTRSNLEPPPLDQASQGRIPPVLVVQVVNGDGRIGLQGLHQPVIVE